MVSLNRTPFIVLIMATTNMKTTYSSGSNELNRTEHYVIHQFCCGEPCCECDLYISYVSGISGVNWPFFASTNRASFRLLITNACSLLLDKFQHINSVYVFRRSRTHRWSEIQDRDVASALHQSLVNVRSQVRN